ncbi:MAG: hypothetical protein ACJ79H_22810, partial [Myxococcales bacterium]
MLFKVDFPSRRCGGELHAAGRLSDALRPVPGRITFALTRRNPLRRRAAVHRWAGSLHEQRTVHLLRGVLIVGSAKQADPICAVETRSSEAVDVIEFQAARLAAFTPLPVGERAAAAVAFEDLALDRVRDVTRRRFRYVLGPSRSRLSTRAEPLL